MVGKTFDVKQQSWKVHWRCKGPFCLRVRVNALNGDHKSAEMVAQQLVEHIESASDRLDYFGFTTRLDELIAAELSRVNELADADTSAVVTSDSAAPVISDTAGEDGEDGGSGHA